MELNSDFTERVVVHGDDIDWVASPMPGVYRHMLDRVGGEVARATSVVRYDAGSAFSRHVHGGGEEYFVLEGTFQDDEGDFPAGSYVRNPPTSAHTPRSEPGCVIFVKLWQFEPDDRHQMHADMLAPTDDTELFRDALEEVRIRPFLAQEDFELHCPGGAELFVLEGELEESGDYLRRWSWLRVPEDSKLKGKAGPAGARVWMKLGNVAHAVAQIARLEAAGA